MSAPAVLDSKQLNFSCKRKTQDQTSGTLIIQTCQIRVQRQTLLPEKLAGTRSDDLPSSGI